MKTYSAIRQKRESGMMIVEATIVFPVMFLVIFVMLFLGNAYYQKARIEGIVDELAMAGASYCADPMLKVIEETGKIPEPEQVDIAPYRYFIGGMNSIEQDIQAEAVRRIDGLSTGLFSGMEPLGYKNGGMKVKFHNYFIASSFEIDLQYKVMMPIRLLGQQEHMAIHYSAHTKVPVGDSTEFIRNVNLVETYMERTGVTDKIKELVEKVRDFFKI